MHRKLLFLLVLLNSAILTAQDNVDCGTVDSILNSFENKLSKINTEDPDLIPLHYYFLLDLRKEMNHFSETVIPLISKCENFNYYQVVSYFDQISFRERLKFDTLSILKNQVDSLFYLKALAEIRFHNDNNALYFLNRALQYNRINSDALILKCGLLFKEEQYDECITLIHVLYNEAKLDREQEKQVIDFTSLFYDKLYRIGDSLVRIDKASQALVFFKLLEQFCLNMPSNYCNDDYYHGILRSKTGVYESYIAIAKAAGQRNNAEMAAKFYEYAAQYRSENQNEIVNAAELELLNAKINREAVAQLETVPETVTGNIYTLPEIDTLPVQPVQPAQPVQPVQPAQPVVKQNNTPEPVVTEDFSTIQNSEKEIAYNLLIIEGIDYCMKEDFEKAQVVFGKAIEISKCNCFPIDERVQILYKEIGKLVN